MDGATDEPIDAGMFAVKDEALWFLYQRMRQDAGRATGGLWIDDGIGLLAKDGSRMTGYRSGTLIGYIGIVFEWDADSGRRDNFYRHQRPHMYLRAASEEVKTMVREMPGSQVR